MATEAEKRMIGWKIKAARKTQWPRPTHDQAGELFGLSGDNFQAAERGKSAKAQQEIVDRAADVWKIPRDWFFDGQYTHPLTGELLDPDSLEPVGSSAGRLQAPSQAEVPLYDVHPSGRIVLVAKRSTKVDADLKAKGAFAVVVSDDDNAPRLLPGRKIIIVPQPFYADGTLVLVEHPTERVEVGRQLVPVHYVRVYGYEKGRKMLRPINPVAESFPFSDAWKIVGLVTAQEIEIAPGWSITERCDTGLPITAPQVS